MKSDTCALLVFIKRALDIFFPSHHPWTCEPQGIGNTDHGAEYKFHQGHEMGRCILPLSLLFSCWNDCANVRIGPQRPCLIPGRNGPYQSLFGSVPSLASYVTNDASRPPPIALPSLFGYGKS